jgi:hypothetical protein
MSHLNESSDDVIDEFLDQPNCTGKKRDYLQNGIIYISSS